MAGAVALVALLGLSAALLWVVGRPLATDDTWWHLAMGETYWSEGLWPASDPLFHTTTDRPPIQHEWLFQVALVGLENLAGIQGLRVVHVLLVAGILAGAFGLFRRAGADTASAALATAILVTVCWYRLIQLRPDVVTVPAFLLLLALVFERDGPASWRRVAAALGLLLIWVNAHSLFAIGLALVLAAALGAALEVILARLAGLSVAAEAAARGRTLLVLLVLGILVTALNPQGFEQHLTFLTESRAGSIWQLQDDFLTWNPLRPEADNRALTPLAWALMNGLLVVWLVTVGATLVRFARERTPEALTALDPVHLGLSAAALVACFIAVRFHWLAALPLLHLLRMSRRIGLVVPGWRWLAATGCVGLALAFPHFAQLAAFASEIEREPGGYFQSPWLDARYCGPATRFLDEAGLEGRLYNPFNLGGFLGYWLAPRLRTFIDGRLDHVPAPVFDDYQLIRRTSRLGPTRRLRNSLDRWGVDLFVADTFPEAEYPGRHSGTHLRRLPEWSRVYASRTCAIYLRRGSENRVNLERVAAYYLERGVPFDRARGLDIARVLADAPDWAADQGLLPPSHAALARLRSGDDARARALALEILGEHWWRVGHFEAAVDADRELVTLVPEDIEARRRLADGLLHLGRAQEALPVARALSRDHPDDLEARYLLEVARKATGRAGAGRAGPGPRVRGAPLDE